MRIIHDEDGYAFTPLAVLLFIPVIIIAISYGNIVNEANMLAGLATGGRYRHRGSLHILNH